MRSYDVDGSADADIVYHEYTHGLSNRLVGNGGGLPHSSPGPWARGGRTSTPWTCWCTRVHKTDPAGPGDVRMGQYVYLAISRIRHQAIDCTVGADAAQCPASGTAGSGGYTYGDLGKVGNDPTAYTTTARSGGRRCGICAQRSAATTP